MRNKYFSSTNRNLLSSLSFALLLSACQENVFNEIEENQKSTVFEERMPDGFGVSFSLRAPQGGGTPEFTASGHVIMEASDDVLEEFFDIKSANLVNLGYSDFSQSGDPRLSFLEGATDITINAAEINSPFFEGNLNFRPANVIMEVRNGEVVSLTSEPQILNEQAFINDSDVGATFGGTITQSVSNTVTSTWSRTIGGGFKNSTKISGKVFGIGAENTTELSFTYSDTKGDSESQMVTVGSTSSISVYLEGGESVRASLFSSKGTLVARINYDVYMFGDIETNISFYNKNGQPNDGTTIPVSIQEIFALNTITSRMITMDLTVDYFSNHEVRLSNPDTNELMGIMPAEILPVQ